MESGWTNQALLVEWALPSVASAALLLWLRTRWPASWSKTLWPGPGLGAFVLLRVVFAVVLLVVAGSDAMSDLPYWVSKTDKVLAGGVVGRDVTTLHGALYVYFQAAGRWLMPGGHPIGVLLPFVIGDLLAVVLGARLARDLLGPDDEAWVGWTLVLTPLLWHQLVVRAQDEPLFLGAVVAGVYLLHRKRPGWASFVLALGFCATKFTFGPYALAAIFGALPGLRQRARAFVVFAATCALVYALYFASGARYDAELAFAWQAKYLGVGISVTDALARVGLIADATLPLAVQMLVSGVLILWLPSRLRQHGDTWAAVITVAAVHAVSMLLQPMCLHPYIVQGLVFVLLVLARARATRWGDVGLWVLPVLGWLVAVWWTDTRAISLPSKPIAIGFHLLVLHLVWRETRRR